MWTNLVNGKRYVGQSKNIKNRIKNFKCLKCVYANEYIDADRKSYNFTDWKLTILKKCDDEEANYWEQYYIKEQNTKYPNGYNVTSGGIGLYGYEHTDETKAKMSKSASERQFGENNPFYGKHLNEKQKEAIKKAIWKPVIMVLENGEKIYYESATIAAEENNLSNSSICQACKGKFGKQGHKYKNAEWYYG